VRKIFLRRLAGARYSRNGELDYNQLGSSTDVNGEIQTHNDCYQGSVLESMSAAKTRFCAEEKELYGRERLTL